MEHFVCEDVEDKKFQLYRHVYSIRVPYGGEFWQQIWELQSHLGKWNTSIQQSCYMVTYNSQMTKIEKSWRN